MQLMSFRTAAAPKTFAETPNFVEKLAALNPCRAFQYPGEKRWISRNLDLRMSER